MMFQLINHTQSFLYANNKPPAKSFYDQMMTNKQKETEEKQRKDEEIKRQQLLEEDLEVCIFYAYSQIGLQRLSHKRQLLKLCICIRFSGDLQ